MSNDYARAWDALAEAIGAASGKTSGSIADLDDLTVGQRFEAAKIAALLSISQELSALNPNNTTSVVDGHTINAWGNRID